MASSQRGSSGSRAERAVERRRPQNLNWLIPAKGDRHGHLASCVAQDLPLRLASRPACAHARGLLCTAASHRCVSTTPAARRPIPTLTPTSSRAWRRCGSRGSSSAATCKSSRGRPRPIGASATTTPRWAAFGSPRSGGRCAPSRAGASPRCTTRAGAMITPEMEFVAIREGMSPEVVRDEVARGRADHPGQHQPPGDRADDHRPAASW